MSLFNGTILVLEFVIQTRWSSIYYDDLFSTRKLGSNDLLDSGLNMLLSSRWHFRQSNSNDRAFRWCGRTFERIRADARTYATLSLYRFLSSFHRLNVAKRIAR